MHTLDQIKDTYNLLNNNITLLDMMLQFEKVIEESGLYGYLNWENGEVLLGPTLKKYWFEIGLMYDRDAMPDPEGALRLKALGCKVFFEEAKFKHSVRVQHPSDVQDGLTRQAKEEVKDIWVVTIKMPRRLINIGIKQYLDLASANLDADFAVLSDGSQGLEGAEPAPPVPGGQEL